MVHGGGNELSVVDGAVAIGVSSLQDPEQFFRVLSVGEALFELFQSDASVSVPVKLLEDLLELDDVLWIGLNRNGHECNLPHLLTLLELFHLTDVQPFEQVLVDRFFRKIPDPPVLECFFCCQSLRWLADKLLDQVLGVVGHFIPLFTVEVEFSLLDHLENLLVVVTVEGWISAKKDVKHAPGGPHITRDVVASFKDLGRDVVWGTSSGLHLLQGALAADDLGESEINDLQV